MMHGAAIAFIWIFLVAASVLSIVLPLTVDKAQPSATPSPSGAPLREAVQQQRRRRKQTRALALDPGVSQLRVDRVAKGGEHRAFTSRVVNSGVLLRV